MAQATRKAKLLAKELNVPVVLLSQLNRVSEGRPAGRPELSQLRESGAIEQDADTVIYVYRETCEVGGCGVCFCQFLRADCSRTTTPTCATWTH